MVGDAVESKGEAGAEEAWLTTGSAGLDNQVLKMKRLVEEGNLRQQFIKVNREEPAHERMRALARTTCTLASLSTSWIRTTRDAPRLISLFDSCTSPIMM